MSEFLFYRSRRQEAIDRGERRPAKKPTYRPRPCDICQHTFAPDSGKQRYCQSCRDTYNWQQLQKQAVKSVPIGEPVSTETTAEAIAAIDAACPWLVGAFEAERRRSAA